MSVADYIKSIAPEDEVLSAIQNNAKGAGLDKLSMDDIDSEIAAYRREEGANTPSHA